jgi:hypothetical protein
MTLDGTKVLTIAMAALISVAPFFLWLALYFATRSWLLDYRFLARWIRVFRWITWSSGLVLLLLNFGGIGHGHIHSPYPMALISFSIGLSFPQEWLKRRALPLPHPLHEVL